MYDFILRESRTSVDENLTHPTKNCAPTIFFFANPSVLTTGVLQIETQMTRCQDFWVSILRCDKGVGNESHGKLAMELTRRLPE